MIQLIKLNQLEIREANETDIPTLISWWANGDLMHHVGFPNGIQTDIEQLRTELIKQSLNVENRCRFIIFKKKNHKAIGELSFNHLDLQNRSCEIGIKICEIDEQGKGYGEEALRGFLTYLFKTYKLHRIYLDTLLENKRAQQLYQKLGFKTIGIARDIWVDSQGNYRSTVLMDLLESDYL